MDNELRLRIVLEKPPADVDFGLQSGGGNNYSTVQRQRSGTQDLNFEFSVGVKMKDGGEVDFRGQYVQGKVGERFIYIDIGTYAGHSDSIWGRRLKVPLRGISASDVHKAIAYSGLVLVTRVPGTGRDGGPNCATVKPFDGWYLK